MFGNMGNSELVLIFLIAVVLFGAKKIPELGRGLGQGIREFKKAMRDVDDKLQEPLQESGMQSPEQRSQENVSNELPRNHA